MKIQKSRGKPYWNLLALREDKNGKRACLGAVLSQDRSESAWISILKALEIPDAGKGVLAIQDGDRAIASAISFILKAREQYPNDQDRVKVKY